MLLRHLALLCSWDAARGRAVWGLHLPPAKRCGNPLYTLENTFAAAPRGAVLLGRRRARPRRLGPAPAAGQAVRQPWTLKPSITNP